MAPDAAPGLYLATTADATIRFTLRPSLHAIHLVPDWWRYCPAVLAIVTTSWDSAANVVDSRHGIALHAGLWGCTLFQSWFAMINNGQFARRSGCVSGHR